MTTSPAQLFTVWMTDWEGIYDLGRQFSQTDVATGLRLCTWPDYLHLRDCGDDTRYVVRRVRANGHRAEHQRLESIEGYVWLEPTHNGHLRRVYAPARYVVGWFGVYHVTRNHEHTLCGWRFNGREVLAEPPAGMRECGNCWRSLWRCVP